MHCTKKLHHSLDTSFQGFCKTKIKKAGPNSTFIFVLLLFHHSICPYVVYTSRYCCSWGQQTALPINVGLTVGHRTHGNRFFAITWDHLLFHWDWELECHGRLWVKWIQFFISFSPGRWRRGQNCPLLIWSQGTSLSVISNFKMSGSRGGAESNVIWFIHCGQWMTTVNSASDFMDMTIHILYFQSVILTWIDRMTAHIYIMIGPLKHWPIYPDTLIPTPTDPPEILGNTTVPTGVTYRCVCELHWHQ